MLNWRHKFCSGVPALVVVGLMPLSATGEGPPDCRIVAPMEVSAEIGVKTEFSLALLPDEGFAISATGPLRISLEVDNRSGLALRRSELRRKHATDPESSSPRFPVTVEATTSGVFSLSVVAQSWLCRAALCRPISNETTIAVRVPALTPDPAAGTAEP